MITIAKEAQQIIRMRRAEAKRYGQEWWPIFEDFIRWSVAGSRRRKWKQLQVRSGIVDHFSHL